MFDLTVDRITVSALIARAELLEHWLDLSRPKDYSIEDFVQACADDAEHPFNAPAVEACTLRDILDSIRGYTGAQGLEWRGEQYPIQLLRTRCSIEIEGVTYCYC